ncbi:MAG: proteasome subunit beta [Candidatus Hadarchaeaceae archaeon]|nr:proteasome subunit beta [Hadesarchaea archaeon]MDH5686228.1 proteasome subunit beta [Hadesarchaea archaeon]
MPMYGFTGTIVGVRCKDGIALASDTRGAAYYLVLSKRVRKIFKLEERIGAAVSGSSGDVQSLVNMLRAEANLYRLNHERPISTKSLAQVASNMLHGRRGFPYIVAGVISGFDSDGPRLYFLDPIGGKLEEEKFASAGTGSTIAYGVLEQNYRDGMKLDDGVKLVAQSIKIAIERDAATGDKIVVAKIDEKGYQELPEEEVDKLVK